MTFRIALAQVNVVVGDVAGNVERLLGAWERAADLDVDLVVGTELAITGYPPEDLLLRGSFVAAGREAVDELARRGPRGTTFIVGGVDRADPLPAGFEDVTPTTVPAGHELGLLFNAAFALRDGEVVATYHKWRLPNFGVFDEARHFTAGTKTVVVDVAGVPVGLTICEDLWTRGGSVHAASAAGARVVVNLNASPYHRDKRASREDWVRHHATSGMVFVAYANQVGGQDELVFDGDSMLMDPTGGVHGRGAQFAEDLRVLDIDPGPVGGRDDHASIPPQPEPARLDPVAETYEALVLGVGDYCRKNGFARAIIGLSGGIDSALTAAIACDALGAENVRTLAMPSPWSSDHSLEDAAELAESFGTDHHVLAIGEPMQAFDEALSELFAGTETGVAEENLQSRIRGTILMACSNKFGSILLSTGNKSEMAVGYATLYGDMNGGFNVLKDVPKLLVYDLCRHRNAVAESRGETAIPERTITKPPSAELRPDQLDTDSLPPYEILDPIIERWVEDEASIADIVADGFDVAVVRRIVGMIDRAEYKRRQSPPGVKITDRAFGKDRRVPITSGWRDPA